MSTHSAECNPHTCQEVETFRSKPQRRAPSMNAACGWTLIRKTSLLRKINPMMRRSSFTNKGHLQLDHLAMNERRNVPEIVDGISELLRRSQTRINLLFTMSEIPHAHPVGRDMRSDVSRTTLTTRSPVIKPSGGARRDRTDDLMLAKHALSQLSYGPVPEDECVSSASHARSPSLALRRSSLRSRKACRAEAA
jgi:hypothetical protein